MAVFIFILIVTIVVVTLFTRDKTKKALSPKYRNADMVGVVLRLDDDALDKLFLLYRKHFGEGAAKYARRTYLKWKSGQVRPNKHTFNRFLVYLPKVMSFDLKCEVLRKLREEYCAKDHYSLSVNTEDWQEKLSPLVTDIIHKAYTVRLPKHLEKRLDWLSDHETEIARHLLAESEAQASKNAVSLLQEEIYNIERLLISTNGRSKVTHTIKLPYGTISLKIKRR